MQWGGRGRDGADGFNHGFHGWTRMMGWMQWGGRVGGVAGQVVGRVRVQTWAARSRAAMTTRDSGRALGSGSRATLSLRT